MSGCVVTEPNGSTRISIEAAIDEHKMRLIEAKMSVIDLIGEFPEIDDIFILRYLLSYSNTDEAIEAIRFSVKYRKENASWLGSAKEGDRSKAPHYAEMKAHLSAGVHKTTAHGAPLLFVRAGMADTNITMACFTEEQVSKYMIYDKEVTFWICDRLSREEGKFCKMITIQDMNNVSFLGNDKRFFSAIGSSSKVSDKIHPQLVQRSVVLNAGESIKLLWQVARLFLSKKTVEKICVCTGFSTDKKASQCPYAPVWTKPEELPTFAGGDCECEGGCVAGLPNDFVGKMNAHLAK